jgi:two-component system sensor histidine kinase DegS
VRLAIGRDGATLTITDDGIGFDVDAVSKNPEKWDHFGLRGFLERARLVGGTAHVASTKGEGTRVEIQVPVKGRKER